MTILELLATFHFARRFEPWVSHGQLQAAQVSMGYVDASKSWGSASLHPVKCPDMWMVIFTSSWQHVAYM